MKILVLGSKGQLGRCLKDQLKDKDHSVIYSSRKQIDITNFSAVKKNILDIKPNIIINAAAYTAVDKAEEDKELTNLINNMAVANLASICYQTDCWLLHVSTDYVFDGNSSTPYKESDPTNPQGVYGLSKLLGEESIQSSGCKYLIFRTAWVYSEYGDNFLKTMLNLGKNHSELNIVHDQIGCPTYAQEIASAIVTVITHIKTEEPSSGIYNFCGNRICSWYEFAQEIFISAAQLGIAIPKKINPINSAEFITKAKRPGYSVLDCSKIENEFKIKSKSLQKGIASSIHRVAAE